MPVEIVLNARVPVKIWTDRIEPEAIEQLKNIADLPVVHPHVAAMPDVHLGKGATVGAVVPTKGAICPAAVGVDIGCGMSARKTSIPADALDAEDLKKLRHSIEREIPVGREQKRRPFDAAVDWMDSHGAPGVVSKAVVERAVHQLGTLGGGNHFIEICVDREDRMLWALLHSGSRNVGKTVAELALRLPPCPSFGLAAEGFHQLLSGCVDVLQPPDDATLAGVADDARAARHG